MATSQTYLQLAPEMGGLRFGPFTGMVQIGSERTRNQLVLDPAHGIFPSHATLIETGPGVYTVGPVDHGCKVFVIPAGQQQMWPVQGYVQARAGDLLIFGTPAGPRFQLQTAAAPTPGLASGTATATGGNVLGALSALFGPPPSNRGTSYGGRVANEMARRSRATLLTKSPWREIYAVVTRFRTGALTNPRVLVSALSAVVTVVLGGGVTCSGLALAVWNAVMR